MLPSLFPLSFLVGLKTFQHAGTNIHLDKIYTNQMQIGKASGNTVQSLEGGKEEALQTETMNYAE